MHLGASLVPVPDSQNQYLTCAYSYTNSFLFQNIPWLNPTGSCFLLKAKQDKPLSVIRPLTEKGLCFSVEPEIFLRFQCCLCLNFSRIKISLYLKDIMVDYRKLNEFIFFEFRKIS